MKIKTAISLLIGLFLFSFLAFSAKEKVLESSLAGSWYSADASTLSADIDKYLSNVQEQKLENVIGLILPHAGYQYSGQTAAYGVKELQGKKYSRVIIIGPSHRFSMKNEVCIPDVDAFRTPLGKIPLDTKFIKRLEKIDNVVTSAGLHAYEHSIQIQLPMLQQVLGKFKLVPIIAGQLNDITAKKIAKDLLTIIDDQTLIIASSDFTHYGNRFQFRPFPNNSQTEAKIKKLDMGAIDKILYKDFDGFYKYVNKTGITVCGNCPILILLAMLPENAKATLLHYDTSGKQSNDFSNSVSYASIAFTGEWKIKTKAKAPKGSAVLTKTDKKTLLSLARKTLVYYIKNRDMPPLKKLGIRITPNMRKKMGVFVTLHKNGMLRGCIGEIHPRRSLYIAVMDQVVNSALRDHRFPPVSEQEIQNMDIEISALTPPKPVSSYKDIVIGRDGITFSKGWASAVFLPQVATEQGWNLEQTLTHLSQKAGLGPDAWKTGGKFTVFQAIVFNEKTIFVGAKNPSPNLSNSPQQ